MPTYRTLCSGGELFGVGADAAGWHHIDGYEIEPAIAAVARLNGYDVRVADVCDVDYAALAPVDHLHASPSCKSASQANVAGGETEEDKAVAAAICRAIRAHTGRSVSIENVWGYRTYESFACILATLADAGFVSEVRHINAADYGVPQTRKRLILRAVRRSWRERVPPLHPTHRRGGDMFHPRWVGWLAAIADILHTLPPTRPAPWQLQRLPAELRETVLVHGTSTMELRAAEEPAAVQVATVRRKAALPKAYLCGGGNTNLTDPTSHARGADEPAFTLRAGGNGSPDRALLIGAGGWEGRIVQRAGDEPAFVLTSAGDNAAQIRAYLLASNNPDSRGGNTRAADEPAQTMTTNAEGRARAWLLDGDNARSDTGEPLYRPGEAPAMTIRGSRVPQHRAYTAGRWVAMTVQALGRFQTVPDGYQGLTAQVNGNGVPCLLAQRMMESLR